MDRGKSPLTSIHSSEIGRSSNTYENPSRIRSPYSQITGNSRQKIGQTLSQKDIYEK